MEYRKMRIGELADQLGVERFVIRFWEKEFAIKGQRSDGGQRFYTERDLQKFTTIKELLYDRGYTIAGAKKFLKDQRRGAVRTEAPVVSAQALSEATPAASDETQDIPHVATNPQEESVAAVEETSAAGDDIVASSVTVMEDVAGEAQSSAIHESPLEPSIAPLPPSLAAQLAELQKKLYRLRDLL